MCEESMSKFPFNLTKGEGKISLAMTQSLGSIKVKIEKSTLKIFSQQNPHTINKIKGGLTH